MAAREAKVRLRLVNNVGVAARSVSPRLPRAAIRPSAAFGPAEQLAPTDARWVLATRVRESLQGGSAGVLPPEQRARLVGIGQRLGLRAFDINLIIAIVQDHARFGREPQTELVARLTMIPGATRTSEYATPSAGTWWAAWMIAALLLAGVFLAASVTWLGT
jgi:hypothetical protein